MGEITKIENHVEQGLERLLEQWKGKPNLEKAIKSLTSGIQDIESVLFELMENRLDISVAVGAQLDRFGTIVGQERLGFDDDFYRILLLARIGINISNGEPERIIDTLKLLTKASYIHYMNLRYGEIAVGSDGVINPLTVEFLIENLQKVVMGGVRVQYLCMYDGDDSFSFDGTNQKTIGKGFGSIYDATKGGKMAKSYRIKKKFSFSGENINDQGFSSIYDPLVGGVFETL